MPVTVFRFINLDRNAPLHGPSFNGTPEIEVEISANLGRVGILGDFVGRGHDDYVGQRGRGWIESRLDRRTVPPAVVNF